MKVEIVTPPPTEKNFVVTLNCSETDDLMTYLLNGATWNSAPGGDLAKRLYHALGSSRRDIEKE